ncbi:MAG: polysaccharide biosynthesis/export family protein [Halothiobacillus sp.]|nr:polysaccharide biosynthesis/export family protein [Halothiobacillus sp.]HQS29586.1 polysaccharide biosynthesis/export family protein [Halothiobacillus sp.]
MYRSKVRLGIFTFVPLLFLQGCASTAQWLPSSGPSASVIKEDAQKPNPDIHLINIDDVVLHQLQEARKHASFSTQFKDDLGASYLVGAGDVLAISLWEAPPATLFSSGAAIALGGNATTQMISFPEQMVSAKGDIEIPFAGSIHATGLTPTQIQTAIEKRLAGKAHDPQVLVRMANNATSTVTIVGDVGKSLRMPLTARGERLLDALAAAGGVRQSVDKETIQLSREGHVLSMPLERVIQEPTQNVQLMPGDVVTVLNRPLKLTVLGATTENKELDFESQGISLAQTLARVGGLQDTRADAGGVFVFRFESPESLGSLSDNLPLTSDGKLPVVFELNLRQPASMLLAQNFMMHDKDVVYVANSPGAELQKFLNILTSSIYSITSLKTIGQ